MTVSTRRRACRSPRFANVMSRSATGRRRLAFVSVVLMLLCVNRAAARFASMRRSCAGPPPRRGPLVGAAISRFFRYGCMSEGDLEDEGLRLVVVAAVEV